MNDTTKKLLIGAAIAGVMGLNTGAIAKPKAAKAGEFKCEGATECKGHGECKTASNECKGHNGCKGQGWVMAKNEAECHKLQAAHKAEHKEEAGKEAPKAN